jgi:hypothetical protein
VDATTQGQGRRPPTLVDEGTSLYTGPTGISPATVTGQHYEPGAKAPRRNAFSAKLTNLRSILLRPGRMGLNPRRLVKATLSGDGRTVLRFSGHWPEDLIATLDGKSVPARGGNGARVVVTLSGGNHHLVIGE